ncbi:leucyl-tRNA synthetase, putative [Medicago truncatula]|uniref:Leucyl-tRNA synthetase, putative n=1 Tax=Medicago truncatula TaxID=3880 RepID=G7KXQ1_MEDTR|nr:leucyl-tRNA synthetase, putative [Medicago truncatula]
MTNYLFVCKSEGELFFGNFPFPYTNGLPSFRPCIFSVQVGIHCGYHRFRASVDKLVREIQQFDNPPVFPCAQEENVVGTEGAVVDDSNANH